MTSWPPGGTRRRLVPLAALLAAGLALGVTTGAAAAPRPRAPDRDLAARAKVLQARLDRQHDALERLTERLDAAGERRRRLQDGLADVQRRQRLVRAELATAQQRLDERARDTYMRGPEWLLAELVGGFGPAQGLSQQPLPRAALEAQAAVVAEVGQRKAELDVLDQWAGGALAEARLAQASDAAQRRRLEVAAARLQATLDGIDRRLGGFLEAQEVRAEAARRAAYAGDMAEVGPVQGWLRAGPAARAAVRWALGQLGDPYRWGADGPRSFDCSGLTSAAYRAAGIAIPRVAVDQWGAGPHPDVAALLPGDLVFYGDDVGNPATIHHVGMYIGNGLMVHAPHTGDVVRIASIWRIGYVGAVRVVAGVSRPGARIRAGGPPAPPPSATPPVPPTMTTASAARPPATTAPRAPGTTGPPAATTTPPTTGAPTSTTAPPPTTGAPTTTVAPTTSVAPTTTTDPPATAASPPTTAAPTTT